MRIKVSREVYEMYKKRGEPLPPEADKMFAQYEGKTLSGSELDKIMGKFAGEKPIARPDAFFPGRVWLLVDNSTFSSASMFATVFRDYEMGKIVGYETGGLPIAFGEIMPFTLHHSGFQGSVSYKQFFPPKPRPGDDQHGVLPDVPLNANLLVPYQSDPDPALAFTLAYIRHGLTSAASPR